MIQLISSQLVYKKCTSASFLPGKKHVLLVSLFDLASMLIDANDIDKRDVLTGLISRLTTS